MAYEWITDALAETWDSIGHLLSTHSDEDLARPSACEGWSVADIAAHITGTERFLQGDETPTRDGALPTYVHNEIGEDNEAWVEYYRALPIATLVGDFTDVTKKAIAGLHALTDDEWEVMGWSPNGDSPKHRRVEIRVLDSWIHLQDMRDALLEPADDHGAGEEIVLHRFEGALPFIVGKKMSVADGTMIRINLSGRLALMVVLVKKDGRVMVVEHDEQIPDLELTTPVALFWRRAAGRISADAFLRASATDVRGSKELAVDFANALNIMI